ncbi:MAG: SOS response-associated peptidase [Rhizobiaceae bacterium]|nr:SOS response-associated peptidase [Rhizobiaceae bacterium]
MCGRFALNGTPEEVEALLAIMELEDFPPRFNIAPTQPVLLVMAGPRRDPGSNLPDRKAMLTRWGFIPGWAKSPKDVPLLINARSETAAEKATFRAAMRHRRALMPASGFYEWKREGKVTKQAYWIRPKNGGVIAFGALMETWAEPGGSEVDTSAILTTTASGDIAAIHDRMPVVIRPEDFSRWLDCVNYEPRDVVDLMRPVEEGFFEAIPVSDKVNKFANTGPDIQERVEPAPQAARIEKSAANKAAPPPAQMKLF